MAFSSTELKTMRAERESLIRQANVELSNIRDEIVALVNRGKEVSEATGVEFTLADIMDTIRDATGDDWNSSSMYC